jgi:hypothetical protein
VNFDLPITIDIDTLGSTAGVSTFSARLSTKTFDFVGMTSATAGDGIRRALGVEPETHAMDFFFCRLTTESLGTFDVDAFISPTFLTPGVIERTRNLDEC